MLKLVGVLIDLHPALRLPFSAATDGTLLVFLARCWDVSSWQYRALAYPVTSGSRSYLLHIRNLRRVWAASPAWSSWWLQALGIEGQAQVDLDRQKTGNMGPRADTVVLPQIEACSRLSTLNRKIPKANIGNHRYDQYPFRIHSHSLSF